MEGMTATAQNRKHTIEHDERFADGLTHASVCGHDGIEVANMIVRKWWCDKCGRAKKYCKCQKPNAEHDARSERA